MPELLKCNYMSGLITKSKLHTTFSLYEISGLASSLGSLIFSTLHEKKDWGTWGRGYFWIIRKF